MTASPQTLRWASIGGSILVVAVSHAELKPATREWRLIANKHWQVVTPPGEDPAVTDAAEKNRGTCPAGMVEVMGKMKVTLMGDEMQRAVCKRWINKEWPERCAEFDAEMWRKQTSKLSTRDMKFCMDRFEYPNRKGENPIILVSFTEGAELCAAEKKRLCTEDEWTFACEGEEAFPYPYGYVRDPDACVVDRPWRQWWGAWGANRASETTKRELDHLWQGVPSGSQPKCRSPFGVYDMVGNIDEWTRSSMPGGNPSIMKGGYWGPVRTRCRPTTRVHGITHILYQQGLRCCADVPR